MHEHDDAGFVFDGEVLALDLINTSVVIRGKALDLLQTPEGLARWWKAACQHRPEMDRLYGTAPVYDEDLLVNVKAFRDALRRLFTAIIEGGQAHEADMDALNGVLQMGRPAVGWQAENQTAAKYWLYDDAQAAVMLPAALSAMRLLTEADLSRLHKCQNQRCVLLFYDTSKSATRRYCSTACLDRERSLQRYAESKREL